MPGRKVSNGGGLGHLASDGPAALYAVDGAERLLVDEAVAEIYKVALAGAAVDFNYDVFTGKDVSTTKIVDAARTLPAFAERRLVLVKGADKMGADTASTLLSYLEDPSPTTTVVFVGEKFDARTKFYKTLKSRGRVIRFDHPKSAQMPEIVRDRAKKLGVRLGPDAVRALVDCVGQDVLRVVQALEKLLLYVGPTADRAVTAEDVVTVVSHVREESIFDLADAIGGRDIARALGLLHGMLSSARAHPLQLLALIARHWRQLMVARSLLDASAPRGEMQSALGVPPFVVKKLVGQAERHPMEILAGGLREIAMTDQSLKGGALPSTRVMERLVLRLASAA